MDLEPLPGLTYLEVKLAVPLGEPAPHVQCYSRNRLEADLLLENLDDTRQVGGLVFRGLDPDQPLLQVSVCVVNIFDPSLGSQQFADCAPSIEADVAARLERNGRDFGRRRQRANREHCCCDRDGRPSPRHDAPPTCKLILSLGRERARGLLDRTCHVAQATISRRVLHLAGAIARFYLGLDPFQDIRRAF